MSEAIDPFSFADLVTDGERSQMDAPVPDDDALSSADTTDDSGVHNLRLLEMQERALAQAKMQKLMDCLLEETNTLVNGLRAVEDNAQLYRLLMSYYRSTEALLLTNGIPKTSNVVKMLEGVLQEFMTILPREERLKSQKMVDLTRLLGDFSTVLLTMRNEGSWQDLDAYVPEVVGITGLSMADVADLEAELTVATTRQDVLTVMNGLSGRAADPSLKQEKLDRFSEGNASLYQLRQEADRWKTASKMARNFGK